MAIIFSHHSKNVFVTYHKGKDLDYFFYFDGAKVIILFLRFIKNNCKNRKLIECHFTRLVFCNI